MISNEPPHVKSGNLGGESEGGDEQTTVIVVISERDSSIQSARNEAYGVNSVPEQNGSTMKDAVANDEKGVGVFLVSSQKDSLPRCGSFDEQCRVCQQLEEEELIDLGCNCRGGLAKAHRSCIDAWFHTKGSNKCEICQEVASNVRAPDPLPNRSNWVWRTDSALRGGLRITPHRQRGWFNPLWVAFSILIGGLLLDVLISVSLGVSALPVNVIIGVLIILGLGTALHLVLECCYELNLGRRSTIQRLDTNISIGGHLGHPGV